MKQFFNLLTFSLWLLGLISLFLYPEYTEILWAFPAVVGAETALTKLTDKKRN